MVVTEGFMSLEIHASWPEVEAPIDGEIPEADIHLSFTAEYSIGAAGQLVTATIIGSYIDEETEAVQWERPGYLREYRVTLRANELELSWGTEGEGTNRMVFKPRRTARPLTRDIFGAAAGRRTSTAGATSSVVVPGLAPASATSSGARSPPRRARRPVPRRRPAGDAKAATADLAANATGAAHRCAGPCRVRVPESGQHFEKPHE